MSSLVVSTPSCVAEYDQQSTRSWLLILQIIHVRFDSLWSRMHSELHGADIAAAERSAIMWVISGVKKPRLLYEECCASVQTPQEVSRRPRLEHAFASNSQTEQSTKPS